MKRHDRLQDLSREHHAALRLALNARRAAASGDPAHILALAQLCRTAFAAELEPHFVLEETTLLPLLIQAGEQTLVARTDREHAELRALVTQLQAPDAGMLCRFADLLTAHVRFEERELFDVLQRHLL